ncbi:MAG: glycosyltransferase family 4 protein [Leptolyngbya sp. SIOISBB]|nr:glycosyltransferase family 4 protein [Leptolyngbya sp. SIOISBB]
MVHIGINGLHIKWGVNAGTETYLTNIILPWYREAAEGVKFTLLCLRPPDWWEGETSHFKLAELPFAAGLLGRIGVEQLLLPATIYRNFDVLFNPGYVGSVLGNTQQVITVHDQFAWLFPSEISRMRSLYWKTLIPITARRAASVIAVSQNTANDLVGFCKIDPTKISIIPEAGDHLQTSDEQTKILEELALVSREYFICVGCFKKIKNPWRILQAYEMYLSKTPKSLQKDLLLVGYAKSKQGEAILNTARSIPNVLCAGRVSDCDLAVLLKNSSGLIFTSLYEGFGIPILEAQSLGCPVITSDVSSMPEVAGEGAILVDPYSVEAICRALSQISLNFPEEIVQKGHENLLRFSWVNASQDTLDLLLKASRSSK